MMGRAWMMVAHRDAAALLAASVLDEATLEVDCAIVNSLDWA